jgi:hypothetical protein
MIYSLGDLLRDRWRALRRPAGAWSDGFDMDAPLPRLAALGNQLIEVHLELREQLRSLRGSLPAHCLAFCAAVHGHHTAEDTSVFPRLAREHPELAPVLAELERDHQQIAEILRRLAAGPSPDELAGLEALLESHFTYEERKLVAALNALDADLDLRGPDGSPL